MLKADSVLEFHLTFVCFLSQLGNDFEDLAKASSRYGVPVCFQSATRIYGQPAMHVKLAILEPSRSFTLANEAYILNIHQLGVGEAVVQLCEVYILWLYPCHLECPSGSLYSGLLLNKTIPVPELMMVRTNIAAQNIHRLVSIFLG
jgi:hypothetical protein